MANEFIKSQKTDIISARRNNEGNIEIDMNTKMVLEDRNQAIETEITTMELLWQIRLRCLKRETI